MIKLRFSLGDIQGLWLVLKATCLALEYSGVPLSPWVWMPGHLGPEKHSLTAGQGISRFAQLVTNLHDNSGNLRFLSELFSYTA